MSRRSPRRSSEEDLQYYQIRQMTLSVMKQWALLLNTPDKRKSKAPVRYYVKSLFMWHDETLNCWTNILSFLVTAYATFQCTSTWAWYVGCVALTTNICSLMAHLFTTMDFRTECIVFVLDLFGVIMLGSLASMSYVGYAYSRPSLPISSDRATDNGLQPPFSVPHSQSLFLINANRSNFIKMTLIAQKMLGMVLLVISIKRYKTGCMERWNKMKNKQVLKSSPVNQNSLNNDVIITRRKSQPLSGVRVMCRDSQTHSDTDVGHLSTRRGSGSDSVFPCEHMDVVKSVSHSFPVAALITIPTAIYTQCIQELIFFVIFLGSTRILLGASNRWLNRRWILHALSHITGALAVGVAGVHLAENTSTPISAVGGSGVISSSSYPSTSPFLEPLSPLQQDSSSLSFFSSISPFLMFIWCDVIMLILIAITVLQLYKHIR